ncbi:MAG TPA: ATPase domain-containing protein [Anaerolineae bacterium]|nr:ATPase domain-containing protein [Anaerolineae bacterium]
MSYDTRIQTGITGFDTMLGGGYLPNTTNLIEGPPGCGKSTLGMQFIYHGAQQGEPGIILTFEALPETYYQMAAAFGWDFRRLEQEGLLKVIITSPEVTQIDLEHANGVLEHTIAQMDAKRILIDSVTHYESAMAHSPNAAPKSKVSLMARGTPAPGASEKFVERDRLYSFLNALKRQGMTTLLTRETTFLFGDEEGFSGGAGIHFIVDSYTMLRYVEIMSAVRRAIIVLKMRGSAHDSAIRQFEIDARGLVVMAPFEGQEGLMSGTPKRMAASFIKAFVRK